MPGGRPRTVSDEEIWAGVEAVIDRAGPNGVTFAAVGAEVGLSAPAVAQRFGSKRALLVAFARRSLTTAASAFGRPAAGRPALDRLVGGLTSMVAGVDRPEVLANNLAFLQLDLLDPELHALAAQRSRIVVGEMQRLLVEATERGELGGQAPRSLAELLHTAYNGALITWAVDGRGRLGPWVRRQLESVLQPYRQSATAGGRNSSRTTLPIRLRGKASTR